MGGLECRAFSHAQTPFSRSPGGGRGWVWAGGAAFPSWLAAWAAGVSHTPFTYVRPWAMASWGRWTLEPHPGAGGEGSHLSYHHGLWPARTQPRPGSPSPALPEHPLHGRISRIWSLLLQAGSAPRSSPLPVHLGPPSPGKVVTPPGGRGPPHGAHAVTPAHARECHHDTDPPG